MSSSNLAARMELAAPDLLSEPPRAKLRVITNTEPLLVPVVRPRTSLEFRRILIRNQGLRTFRDSDQLTIEHRLRSHSRRSAAADKPVGIVRQDSRLSRLPLIICHCPE